MCGAASTNPENPGTALNNNISNAIGFLLQENLGLGKEQQGLI